MKEKQALWVLLAVLVWALFQRRTTPREEVTSSISYNLPAEMAQATAENDPWVGYDDSW